MQLFCPYKPNSMPRKFTFIFLVFLTITNVVLGQLKSMRGTVIDISSHVPIVGAHLWVQSSHSKGTTSDSTLSSSNQVYEASCDSNGSFYISSLPIGRYDIKVLAMGYEPVLMKEISITSGKETYIDVVMKEKSSILNEIIVKQAISKNKPINTMALVSARMLSVEEANRYAGGFDDPSRLASSFAGVSSNVGSNGIVVRGNAPKSLQWKMEGIEVPNPNHFADLTGFGGGGLTALSSQMLANSDFLTGAFPAEYSNALSGVFDIFIRNGNRYNSEHTFQLGIIGIDASSEGPINKLKGSSYLFNYRYSTLSLIAPILPKEARGVKYQDLCFKLNFPSNKFGTLSVWAIGLLDNSGNTSDADSSLWQYEDDSKSSKIAQYMVAGGLTYKKQLNAKGYLRMSLNATTNGIDLITFTNNFVNTPTNSLHNKLTNVVFTSFVNTKYNALHTNRSGIVATALLYKMDISNSQNIGAPIQSLIYENGLSSLITAYSNSSIKVSSRSSLVCGINSSMFTLNNRWTIEPRFAFNYQVNTKNSFALAYGLHSRLERINTYFIKNANGDLINKNLDFSKAHHIVLSYIKYLGNNLNFKTELYGQYLFSIPVIADSSFSFINMQSDFYFNAPLQNTGLVKNFGLDITLEKYLTKGYYYLVTGSVFNSTYKGGDGIWRNTRYNQNYIFNFLVGKEWNVGKTKNKIAGANVRINFRGGDRYTPVNYQASQRAKYAILDESNAFSSQIDPAFVTHFTLNYKINLTRSMHEIAFKMLNSTFQKEFQGFSYNLKTGNIDRMQQLIFVPNLSYKIEF